METLSDLIARHLALRGETLTAFAERIGSNRQTIRGWQASLPAPAMLTRVADALDIPYPTVLIAGLRSAEYIDNPADILAGQTVHAVARCDGTPYERGEFAPTAVFTNPDRAREFVDVSNAVTDDASFEYAPIVIDAAQPPPSVRIYTMSWSNRTDRITETSALAADIPTRLENRTVSEISGLELADTGEIYRLRVDSLDPRAGREALQEVIDRLRSEGRLLSPEVDTRGQLSGMSEWAFEEHLLAGVVGRDVHNADQWRTASQVLSATQGSGARDEAWATAGLPVPPIVPRPPASELSEKTMANVGQMPYVWGGRAPIQPTRTPVALTEAQPGDVGFIGGHTVTVVGPGEVIGADGQRQSLADLVDKPDFEGIFRIDAPSVDDSRKSNPATGLRRRRVVINPGNASDQSPNQRPTTPDSETGTQR